MTRRADAQLLALARLVENLATIYPDAIDRCHLLAADHDGYPTQAIGASPPSGRTPDIPEDEQVKLDAVERAVAAREHWTNHRLDLEAGLRLVTVTIHDMIGACHKALRGAVEIQGPKLCDPHGREGAIEWADYTCRKSAVKAGLCDPCYQRERRWRIAHGLDPRL